MKRNRISLACLVALVLAFAASPASAELTDKVIRLMAALNHTAADIMSNFDVSACTDVTGFGLSGHALEMAEGSGVGLVIDTTALPLLEGIPMVCHPDPTDALGCAKAIARHRVSILCSTSTFLRLYSRNRRIHPMMLESLRIVVAGAELTVTPGATVST